MLGFDPTIEMLVSPNQAVPSYRPNKAFIKAYQTARHNRQWVITMNDGTKYVTVETVSSVRAGFMRGRGGIVWVVVPFDKAERQSEVGRSYEIPHGEFVTDCMSNSRFTFLSNRGALVTWKVKASFTRDARATMSARLNYVKRSRFMGRKILRTH